MPLNILLNISLDIDLIIAITNIAINEMAIAKMASTENNQYLKETL